ncbi:MAG: hypothetical protein Q8906_07720 [Bacillota bacterium]|nr:hypothetical protein [Bacillota bacterium]
MDNKDLGTGEKQLKTLREINEICLSHKFDLWLRGGWAIDFLLGKITRLHSDIDLVTLIQYRERIEQTMIDADFKKIPVGEFQTDFLKNDIDVSFVFVRLSDDGNIIANGFPDWVWRKDALSMQNYHLQGISMNVLNPRQLLEEKKVYEQGTGRKLRPKDIDSMKIIQEIIDSIS